MVEPLDVTRVEIRGGPLVLATPAEVDALEVRLGVRFPAGYREYVTQLGEGTLNTFVRVLPPWRILQELGEHQGMMAGFWFWESDKVVFSQQQAMESIAIADTLDGDLIVFHPSDPRQLFVLPRNDERLYARGPGLLETINWVCSGRVLRSFGPNRYFEPSDSRREAPESPVAERTTTADQMEPPPDLARPPRDVLMAYFAELSAVEEWALRKSGGPEGLRMDEPPDLDDDWDEELLARSERVHARYCSESLANALRGASVLISWPLEHDPASIRLLDERETRPGRVVIRAAEGPHGFVHEYVLDRTGNAWQIKSRKDIWEL